MYQYQLDDHNLSCNIMLRFLETSVVVDGLIDPV